MQPPTKLEFSQYLQTPFHLDHGADKAVPLKLIEFKDGSPLFHGPHPFVLPRKTYQMKHENIGEFDLFLVLVNGDDNGLYYEAVFNRSV
jgi:uncharacterized protein DUF6916